MILHVESEAGLHGEREPRAFLLGGERVAVARIVDRWFDSNRTWFKVATDNGATCILRYDALDREWELTMFRSAGLPAS